MRRKEAIYNRRGRGDEGGREVEHMRREGTIRQKDGDIPGHPPYLLSVEVMSSSGQQGEKFISWNSPPMGKQS